MKRHCSVCGSIHHDKRFHKKHRSIRRNVDAFTDGSGVHPIRGSRGYDAALAGDSQITQAKEAWRSGRAYIDGNGNYHIKPKDHKWRGTGSGPIAPWNKAAKKRFKSATELHNASHYRRKLV